MSISSRAILSGFRRRLCTNAPISAITAKPRPQMTNAEKRTTPSSNMETWKLSFVSGTEISIQTSSKINNASTAAVQAA